MIGLGVTASGQFCRINSQLLPTLVRPLTRQKIPFVEIWTRQEMVDTTIDRVFVVVSGESVRIERGKIYLNDQPFDAESVPKLAATLPEYIIPQRTIITQNDVFALGGQDEFGSFTLLRIESIIGRATCVWVSLDRARIGTEVR
jgi:hypothetical protein